MANLFLSVDRNDPDDNPPDGVTVGSSTSSKTLELRIDDTAGWTTLEIDQALQSILFRLLDYRNSTGTDV